MSLIEILSNDQIIALGSLKKWYIEEKRTPYFVLGGSAGTGKTTLLSFLSELIETRYIHYCAYTGKASDVLLSKGIKSFTPPSTIHRLIYNTSRDDNGKFIHTPKTAKEMEHIDLIVVDESSMVGRYMFKRLISYKIPVLFVGDYKQLPSIGDDNFNIMNKMSYTLTHLHRHSKNSDIVRLANISFGGGYINYGRYKDVIKMYEHNTTSALYAKADQIICGYNKTRIKINRICREYYGFLDEFPVCGDKVICTANGPESNQTNGKMFTVVSCDSELDNNFLFTIGLNTDDGYYIRVKCKATPFVDINVKEEQLSENIEWQDAFSLDFGYCLTVHKFQGSECNKLIVIDEALGDTKDLKNRWRYTAYTRAKNQLIIIS